MSLKWFNTTPWGPKGLLEVYKPFFAPFSVFGAFPGGYQEISQLSARFLPTPPPSWVKVCFFTSGTQAGDIGYTTPYFKDAEGSHTTLFPPINTYTEL